MPMDVRENDVWSGTKLGAELMTQACKTRKRNVRRMKQREI